MCSFPIVITQYGNCPAHYPGVHVAQSKKIQNAQVHCERFLGGQLSFHPSVEDELHTQEGVRHVWEKLIEMIIKGFPFTIGDRLNKLPRLVGAARTLFPFGPPHGGYRWHRAPGQSASEYARFLEELPVRTTQCPISPR